MSERQDDRPQNLQAAVIRDLRLAQTALYSTEQRLFDDDLRNRINQAGRLVRGVLRSLQTDGE